MTCATCEGQNDVLWLLEDYDALKACSRCGAMLVCLCVDMYLQTYMHTHIYIYTTPSKHAAGAGPCLCVCVWICRTMLVLPPGDAKARDSLHIHTYTC